jgi:diadenosine tetraphosphate (Ap4A) HIT family hydrolase
MNQGGETTPKLVNGVDVMRSDKFGPHQTAIARLLAQLTGNSNIPILGQTPEVARPRLILPGSSQVRLGELPAETQGHNLREVFKSMFGDAFALQTGRSPADVGLRGRLWVNPETGRLGSPSDGFTADQIKSLPYLSWFQEDEAKYSVPTTSYDKIDEALREASRTGDLSLVVGDLLGSELKAGGFVLEKIVEEKSGRQFRDAYYDDEAGTATKKGLTIRFRQVADEIGTDKGRFTAKILGPRRGAVWSRGEVKFTAGADFPEKKFLQSGAVADEINPVAYLRKFYQFGELRPSVIIQDERHEFVLKNPETKESLYLVTLDAVTATTPDGKKEGKFYEVEMERIVGSDDPKDQAAQRQFAEAFAHRFGLKPSSMTKAQNGIAAINAAQQAGAVSAEQKPSELGPVLSDWAKSVVRGPVSGSDLYQAAQEAAERARPNVQRLRDPFQRVVDGNRAGENVVWENDRFMVIEDKFGGGGHTLVLPKELKNFPTDLSAQDQKELESITAAVASAFGSLGMSKRDPGVWVNPPSALTVQRLHVHIAPSADMNREAWARLGAELTKTLGEPSESN